MYKKINLVWKKFLSLPSWSKVSSSRTGRNPIVSNSINRMLRLGFLRGLLLIIFSLFLFTQAAQATVQPSYYSIGDLQGTWNMHSIEAGDKYESDARSQNWHYGTQYIVDFSVEDPSHEATSVEITGPEILVSLSIDYDDIRKEWNSWWNGKSLDFGGSPPEPLPLEYTFTIVDPSGTTIKTDTVERFIEVYADNLSPVGAVTGPQVDFSWTGVEPSYSHTYAVELSDAVGTRIWNVYGLTATSVNYDGPALTSGEEYIYWVVVNDEYGNGSFAEESFVYQTVGYSQQTFKSSDSSDRGGWSYGTVYIDDSGDMEWTYYRNEDGDTSMEDTPLAVSITSDGIVIVADDTFHGTMSLDKNMVVATGGDEEGYAELIILQKSGGTFETSDLEGSWDMHALQVGTCSDSSGWAYGIININNSGVMQWQYYQDMDEDETDTPAVGTLSITSAGIVTFTLGVEPLFHGVMSQDKRLVVGINTTVDGECEDYQLIILQKSSGDAFATSDLQGEWNMHSLSSGASGQSGWSRGTVEIDAVGNMEWPFYRDSEGGTLMEDAPDTAYINLENGTWTVTVNDDDSFHGVMSDDKRLVVGTAGIVGGGYEFIVLQKSVGPEGVFSRNVPGGTTASAYVMISSPVFPINQDPLANLEDDLGSYDKTKWRLFRWNPMSSAYEEYPFTTGGLGDVVPGKGYWLISRDTKNIDITGLLAEMNSPYSIPLSPGWNQIGNPFNFDIDLDTAVQVTDDTDTWFVTDSVNNNLTFPTLWKYTGVPDEPYTASAVMSPGEGYWIKNITTDSPRNVSLIVDPIESTPLEVYGESLEQTLTLFAKLSGEETPPPPPGGTGSESDEEGSSSGGGSGCFIATACFGSPMSGEVSILRNFRDRYLLTNPIGKVFVSTYYSSSPKVADFIAKHEFLKVLVRTSLYSIVKSCGLAVED